MEFFYKYQDFWITLYLNKHTLMHKIKIIYKYALFHLLSKNYLYFLMNNNSKYLNLLNNLSKINNNKINLVIFYHTSYKPCSSNARSVGARSCRTDKTIEVES